MISPLWLTPYDDFKISLFSSLLFAPPSPINIRTMAYAPSIASSYPQSLQAKLLSSLFTWPLAKLSPHVYSSRVWPVIDIFIFLARLWISEPIICWERASYTCKSTTWFYAEKWQFCQSWDIVRAEC